MFKVSVLYLSQLSSALHLLSVSLFAGTSCALLNAFHQAFLFLAHSEFVFKHLAFKGKVSLLGSFFFGLGTIFWSLELTRMALKLIVWVAVDGAVIMLRFLKVALAEAEIFLW